MPWNGYLQSGVLRKILNNCLCLHHHTILPSYLLHKENVWEDRSNTPLKLLGFVDENWLELPHSSDDGGEGRGIWAFQAQNCRWHLLSYLARHQCTRSLERIKMFTLWFLAKIHKHKTFFMFQVALHQKQLKWTAWVSNGEGKGHTTHPNKTRQTKNIWYGIKMCRCHKRALGNNLSYGDKLKEE